MSNQQGFGLAEVLIALLLASFTMTALMRHYLQTKNQYHYMQTTLEQRLDVQLATELIRHSVRHAGFSPCLGIEQLVTLDARNALLKLKSMEVEPGILRIQRMSEHFNTVVQVISDDSLLTTTDDQLRVGQAILIADCYHAEVHLVRELRHEKAWQRITLLHALHYTYHEPIYLGEWIEESYFIHPSREGLGRLNYRRLHSEELTPAVQRLSVQVDTYDRRRFLTVNLGLDNARSMDLETYVRTP